jgi:hypothetical protein
MTVGSLHTERQEILKWEAHMKDEDLLKCPLLQGLDPMHRAQLIGLLNDSHVRESLEQCLADHLAHTAPADAGNTKPQESVAWRRSSKE